MQAPILESIRKNLFEKRDRINEWLQATPLSKKEVFLGPSTEQAVHARLDAIDDAISKADSRILGKSEVCQGQVETELLEIGKQRGRILIINYSILINFIRCRLKQRVMKDKGDVFPFSTIFFAH